MLLALCAIILTLILVIGLHEAAHALVARFYGVKIKTISIGFGKALWSWRSRNGCEWRWAFFPLGGFVQLENSRIVPVKKEEYIHCFDKKKWTIRIFILVAGSVVNLGTAWIALFIMYSNGLDYMTPEVHSIIPHSTAAAAGMKAGDRFISVNHHATSTWNEVGMRIIMSWGQPTVDIIVSQNNGQKLEQISLDLSQQFANDFKTNLLHQIGLTPNEYASHHVLRANSLGEAITLTNQSILFILCFFIILCKHVIVGLIPFASLLGPLSIFVVSVHSLMDGISVFAFFIANLSLAVALVNLFPIPGLDGGSIIYVLIEKIRGKPVSIAMEVLLHRLAVIVFAVILVNLVLHDLLRIIHSSF